MAIVLLFMSGETTETGVTRLQLEIWHPGCWSIAVTEQANAGLLGYGSAVTTDGRVLCRTVVYGETISEVETLIEKGHHSPFIRAITETNTTARDHHAGSKPGNAVKEVLVEKSTLANQIGKALFSHGFVRAEPYIVADGIERWSLLTRRNRPEIGVALDEIRDQEDADITLTRITQAADSEPAGDLPLGRLSVRQYEVFQLARRQGYYAWPRETTAQELADDLEITTSTLHEHLHKAEAKLLDGSRTQ